MHIDADTLSKALDHASVFGAALLGSWLRGRDVKAALAVLASRVLRIERFLKLPGSE